MVWEAEKRVRSVSIGERFQANDDLRRDRSHVAENLDFFVGQSRPKTKCPSDRVRSATQ